MSNPPPRAPTFPKFIDQGADASDLLNTPTTQVVDETDNLYKDNLMDDTLASMNGSRPIGGVPVVALPTSERKSVIGRIILWRDVKLTGIYFGSCMAFFYMTLVRGEQVLSVLGLMLSCYQVCGMILVKVNKQFLKNATVAQHITRPADPNAPIVPYDIANNVAKLMADEINDIRYTLRDFMYCDQPAANCLWAFGGFMLSMLGRYFSFLSLMLIGTLLLFSVPLAYDKNKKQVDDTLAKATDSVQKQVVIGQRMASEKTAELLDKAPPAARQLAARVGLTPQKKSN